MRSRSWRPSTFGSATRKCGSTTASSICATAITSATSYVCSADFHRRLYHDGLTDEQLFFLAYAQNYCEHDSEAIERFTALTDTHAPENVRVNGTLVQVPEFAAAFECSPGTPMHPTNRCEVW